MSLSVRSLGSGSSGNAVFIESGETTILVDCGVGPRALAAGLRAGGRRLDELSAVLLSHEHSDHVQSLPPLLERGIPVISTAGTAHALTVPAALWREAPLLKPVHIGGLTATAVAVCHDAVDPCGYAIDVAGHRIVIFTDLGHVDATLHEMVATADLVILEANHDEELLRRGPYPARLKRRVLSARGHLSNAAAARLLAATAGGQTGRTIWLAHLSRTNNRPEIAAATVRDALARQGRTDGPVVPLSRHGQNQVWRPGTAHRPDEQLRLPFL